jgi:hypothetical protein
MIAVLTDPQRCADRAATRGLLMEGLHSTVP